MSVEFCSSIGLVGLVVCEFWLLLMGVLVLCVSLVVYGEVESVM